MNTLNNADRVFKNKLNVRDDFNLFKLYVVEKSDKLADKGEKQALFVSYYTNVKTLGIKRAFKDYHDFTEKQGLISKLIINPKSVLTNTLKDMYEVMTNELYNSTKDPIIEAELKKMNKAFRDDPKAKAFELEAELLLSGSLALSDGINNVYIKELELKLEDSHRQLKEQHDKIAEIDKSLQTMRKEHQVLESSISEKFNISRDDLHALKGLRRSFKDTSPEPTLSNSRS